jgi:hypothetical protein
VREVTEGQDGGGILNGTLIHTTKGLLLLNLLHVTHELPDDVVSLGDELLERLVQVVRSKELGHFALLGVQLGDLLALLVKLVALTLDNGFQFHAFLS